MNNLQVTADEWRTVKITRIEDNMSMRGCEVVVGLYKTENLSVDHSWQCLRRVSSWLHVRNLIILILEQTHMRISLIKLHLHVLNCHYLHIYIYIYITLIRRHSLLYFNKNVDIYFRYAQHWKKTLLIYLRERKLKGLKRIAKLG